MPLPTDETTIQLEGEDPIPSGAGARKPAETAVAGPPPAAPAAPKPMMPVPDLKTSARFYDQVLTLKPEDQDKVIDEMHPEDLKGFLAYTSIPGAGAGKASPQGGQTATPEAGNPPPPDQGLPEGETLTEVPLTKPDGSPAVSHVNRALAQNFANDAQGQAAFYRNNHPDLEFGVFPKAGRQVDDQSASVMNQGRMGGLGVVPQYTGDPKESTDRVYARPKGSKVWSAVDPDTGIHPLDDPKEFAQDLGDNAYKLGAGVPIAAATAAGGLVGGAGGFPLLGAMGMGGGAAAATEGLRQMIGGGLGMQERADRGKVAEAGAAGAVTPLIFGTGATPKAAAAAGVDYGGQRGLVGRAFDKTVPGLSSWISGIPSGDIRFARDNLPEIKAAEKGGQGALDSKTREVMDGVREGLMSMQREAWNDIQAAIDKTKTPVDITHAKDALHGQITALENRQLLTSGEKEQLAALKGEYDRAFFQQPQGQLRAQIQAEAKANAANIAALAQHVDHPEILAAMQQRQEQLEEALTRGIEVPDQVGAKDALRIKSMLSDTANWRTAGADRYGKLNEAERGVQLAGSNAYGALNDAVDTAVAQAGQSYKGLNQKYAAAKDLQEFLRPFMGDSTKDEVKSAQILRNLNAKGNSVMRDRLETLDKQYPGHNIIHNANMLNAITTFSHPSATALNGYGSTSTTKTNNAANIFGSLGAGLGGLAGFFLGGGADGDIGHAVVGAGGALGPGWAGREFGKMVGPRVSSPSALRTYMNIGNGVRAPGAALRKGAQVVSPWGLEQIKKEFLDAQGQ